MEQLLLISIILVWIVVISNLLLTLALVRRINASGRVDARVSTSLPVGGPAPAFQAETLDGRPVNLESYLGRTVAFLFVAPNCGPCLDALPEYEALYEPARQAGVELTLVSTADAAQTRRFADEHQIHLPVLVAPRESNGFVQAYQVTATPAFCLLDANGRVLAAGYPSRDWGNWQRLTESWISQAESFSIPKTGQRR